MTRTRAAALVALALTAGLALRVARLDERPMHHDEANQAVKFGALLERGEYRYDAHDHHGPTLYYLTLPSAWLRGQQTFASLDEATLRGVPVLFGAGTILLLPLLSAGIGRASVVTAATLMALSPAMVFYSRMYIHETLFAGFALAFVIGVGRVATGGGLAWAAMTGIAAGLAMATKETAAIVLPSAVAAAATAWWSVGAGRPANALTDGHLRRVTLVGLAAAAGVATLFYSSFLTAPGAMVEPFRGARIYLDRGIDPVAHAQPWYYYLRLLTYTASGGLRWSEGLVLALAALGAITAWRRSDGSRAGSRFWPRYLAASVLISGAIFAVIPYKTPWNLVPVYAGVFPLAGVGFTALVNRSRSRPVRVLLAGALAAGCVHLGWQAWCASITYAADPRNPYVYAQTVPDAVRMAARIRDLAAIHRDGARMQVSVMAPASEQWPLPWYLRAMPNVGYWTAPGDELALQAPVIVSSLDHTAGIEQALGDRYVSEYFGLRPELLLAVHIERGLWDRFLAERVP
jgi:uncharacterized protein (TIGR03663 family)